MADVSSIIDRCLSTQGRRKRLNSLIAGVACSVGAAMAMLSSGGCTAYSGLSNSLQYNECCDGLVMGFRNSAWSARAWHERRHCFKNEPYLHDFKEGFRAGYQDVASGANGCTPTFPPRDYWSWKYQSPEGQKRVAAWFAGYPHGARAAEEDGLQYYGEIQMSCEMQAACQQCGLGPANPPLPGTQPQYPGGMPGEPMPTGIPGQPIEQSMPYPQTPIATPSQANNFEGLLDEGEQIVGKVKIQSESTVPSGSGASLLNSPSGRNPSGSTGLPVAPVPSPPPF